MPGRRGHRTQLGVTRVSKESAVSIAIKCSGCKKVYKLRDELAGKRVKCQCGQAMKIPALPEKPAAVDGLDPMGAFLDGALPPTEAAKPGGPRQTPAVEPAAKSAPAKIKKKATKKENGELSPRVAKLMGLGMVVCFLGGIAVVTFFVMRSYRPGSASPEEAFAAHQAAMSRDDCRLLMRAYSAESHAVLADGMLAFASESRGGESRGGQSLAESSTFVKAVLQKHGVAGMLGGKDESAGGSDQAAADGQEETSQEQEAQVAQDSEALAREAGQRRKKAVSAIKDKATFCKEYWLAIKDERNKTLPRDPVKQFAARKQEADRREYLVAGRLGNVKIDGDTATGEMTYNLPEESEAMVAPVAFKKNDGRWFLHFGSVEDLTSSPLQTLLSGRAKLDFADVSMFGGIP